MVMFLKMKIWKRYFISEVLKVFFLFLGAFYFLYVLIDYSSHTSTFAKSDYSFFAIATYYFCHFFWRLEVLIPFALMLATMRTLCMLNLNNELVAMLASGIRLKTLMRPFIAIALCCVAFIYLNFEVALPNSLRTLRQLEDTHRNDDDESPSDSIHSFMLRDNSTLLYQNYDSARERFFDVYWLRSGDELYRIKYLYPHPEQSVGAYVDKIARDDEGGFHVEQSWKAKTFSELGFEDDVLDKALLEPDYQAISTLWRHLGKGKLKTLSDDEAMISSAFHFKLVMPWLSLLVVLAPMPFCLRFTRHLNVYFIYGIAIMLFLAFFTFLNATVVLGENQVIPPQCGAWIPFAFFFVGAFWLYRRME